MAAGGPSGTIHQADPPAVNDIGPMVGVEEEKIDMAGEPSQLGLAEAPSASLESPGSPQEVMQMQRLKSQSIALIPKLELKQVINEGMPGPK